MISTMQPLTQAGATSEPGFALKVAEASKLASHNAECRNIGVLFFPVIVETLSGWSPDSSIHSYRTSVPFYHPLERECHPMVSPPTPPLCLGGWEHLTSPLFCLYVCITYVWMFVTSLMCTVFVVCIFWFWFSPLQKILPLYCHHVEP